MPSTERVVPVVMKLHEGGRVRTVRVGQAFVTEHEVVLSLEPMTLQHGAPLEAEAEPDVATGGRSGNQLTDLEWLAQRSRRILADPRKQRWHDDMRAQLSRIEAEMERLKARSPH